MCQVELRDEDQKYRAYLQRLKADEEQREKEIDRLCDIEVEKSWQKKIAQWKTERQARQTLLEQVLDGRQKQVADKRKCASLGVSCEDRVCVRACVRVCVCTGVRACVHGCVFGIALKLPHLIVSPFPAASLCVVAGPIAYMPIKTLLFLPPISSGF